MMKELMVNQEEKVDVIDSREVAEMMGRSHADIMKMIQGSGKNLGIIPVLEKGNFPVSDYFIESTYKVANNNKTYGCYLVTKMGCEMLGNKLQGEKGILFTASYVKRFNDMEKQLGNNIYSYMIEDPIERALKWAEEMKKSQMLLAEKDEVIEELSPLAELARKRIDKTGTISLTDVTKAMELKRGQITVWAKTNGYIHKSIQEVNKKGEEYFKVVCHDGEHKGIAVTEEGLRFIDKNIEEIKKCPCKMKKAHLQR